MMSAESFILATWIVGIASAGLLALIADWGTDDHDGW
jgi:hypothetical protein